MNVAHTKDVDSLAENISENWGHGRCVLPEGTKSGIKSEELDDLLNRVVVSPYSTFLLKICYAQQFSVRNLVMA
ncbi:MAG: hypothetical protein AOA66_1349 [Candidatus Bathyarchaeota archaeon BA2]|nr:MAG: hypothetical protein AOA66_1349 [Candidatus Bathyarchaeota archaeon BA2]